MIRGNDIGAETVSRTVSRHSQSAREFNLTDPMTVVVKAIEDVNAGARKPILKRLRRNKEIEQGSSRIRSRMLYKSRSVISVSPKFKEGLCIPVSLLLAKARFEMGSSLRFKLYKQNEKLLEREVLDLLSKIGEDPTTILTSGSMGIDQLAKLAKLSHFFQYNIQLFDFELSRLFSSKPANATAPQLNLLIEERHCFVLVNLLSFAGWTGYCSLCSVGFVHWRCSLGIRFSGGVRRYD
jgi:hypothetical protein